MLRSATGEIPPYVPRQLSHGFSFSFNADGARAVGAELERRGVSLTRRQPGRHPMLRLVEDFVQRASSGLVTVMILLSTHIRSRVQLLTK
jgi:hypothetical protein